MKTTFLILSSLFLANIALADVPEIVAKKVTCQELKDQLANYKQLVVIKKKLLSTKKVLLSTEVECGAGRVEKEGIFKTSDVDSCVVGKVCKEVRPVVTGHTHVHVRHRPVIVRHHPYGRIHRPVIIRPVGPRYRPHRPGRVIIRRCHGLSC